MSRFSVPARRPARRVLSIAALAAVITLGTGIAAVPPGPIPFGAYDPGGDFSDETDVIIEHLFLPLTDVYLPSLFEADDYAQARNRALLVTVEPWTWTRDERNTPEALRGGIFAGQFDQNITDICGAFAQMKSPVTLRWAHEMDETNGQFIWSNWRPADYVAAYRRVADVCRRAFPEVVLMWSPVGNESLVNYYPGENYVDLVGLSVFGLQAYDKLQTGADRSFTDILGPRYALAERFGKPVVVAELGYSGDADYVAAWEAEVRKARPEYPNLVGVVYFDQKEVYPWPDNLGLPDWRLDQRVIAPN